MRTVRHCTLIVVVSTCDSVGLYTCNGQLYLLFTYLKFRILHSNLFSDGYKVPSGLINQLDQLGDIVCRPPQFPSSSFLH